jgi:hypothetical protein
MDFRPQSSRQGRGFAALPLAFAVLPRALAVLPRDLTMIAAAMRPCNSLCALPARRFICWENPHCTVIYLARIARALQSPFTPLNVFKEN